MAKNQNLKEKINYTDEQKTRQIQLIKEKTNEAAQAYAELNKRLNAIEPTDFKSFYEALDGIAAGFSDEALELVWDYQNMLCGLPTHYSTITVTDEIV